MKAERCSEARCLTLYHAALFRSTLVPAHRMTLTMACWSVRYRLQWLLILAIALPAVGCVSTQDRYEKAQELTVEGRYAEAARYYVRVLREEPDWSGARNELQAVGQRAVDRWIDDAEQAASEGRYEPAVAALDAVDALRADTESVGVVLTVPDDYNAFRRETVRAAADMLIEEGRRAEEAEDWPVAVDAYEGARPYVQREERLTMLDRAQARALLRWSEDEMTRGYFRTAYERAEAVVALAGPEHALATDARALQQTAVERGTRFVAFVPLWRVRSATAALPEFFRDELNAVLQYDYWSNPPLFIAPVDPIETRRALRQANLHRTVLSNTDAAEAGRVLGADFVVTGELVAFERVEDDLEETAHPARIRVRGATGQGPSSRDTSYVVQTFDLELEAAVEYRIVDVRTGRVVDRGVERVRHEGRRQRGIFRGDYRRLDLSGSELSLFDPDDQRAAERQIENQLIDRMAAAFAEDVFGDLLRRID